jgi:hypothetical protein
MRQPSASAARQPAVARTAPRTPTPGARRRQGTARTPLRG